MIENSSDMEEDVLNDEATANESSEPVDTKINVRELFLESQRADLEANYDRLREIGTEKRETDMEILERIRERSKTKATTQKLEIVADAVDALIILVVRIDALP